MQDLKSAMSLRVDSGQALRLAGQRQALGEPLLCPAGAGDIHNDIYGRPVSQNTLKLNDSSCSSYTMWSARKRIQIENGERPYLPIAPSGLRTGGDMMAKSRDQIPQNLYGEGGQGNFVRQFPTANNFSWDAPYPEQPGYYHKQIQPFTFSHDATTYTYRG